MYVFHRIAALFSALAAFLSALLGGNVRLYKDNFIYIDAAYGRHERQILDLYIPRDTDGEAGLIMMIHGGGWIMGDKDAYRGELAYWAGKGYVAAAMDYHYIDDDTHMDTLMDDVSCALEFIKNTAAKKGVDVTKALFTGSSAGGHMSLLYAYAYADVSPIRPAAVVSYCGPSKLWDDEFIMHNEFGSFDPALLCDLMSKLTGETITPDDYQQHTDALKKYSPLCYVNEKTVPTVIAQGMVDTVVPYQNAVELDERLTEYGVAHDFVPFPNSGHGLDSDPGCAEQTRALFERYAQIYLK